MNVIFFDLDKLIVQDSAQKIQYESMQQVLASLMQNEACTGTNFIVHLKSEAVYKIVASSSSSSSAVSMSGAELDNEDATILYTASDLRCTMKFVLVHASFCISKARTCCIDSY